MFDYYPAWTGLSRQAIAKTDLLERQAIERADLLYYPTKWAACSAIVHYGADPSKVHVQPYGANLKEVPSAPDRDRQYCPKDLSDPARPGSEGRADHRRVHTARTGGMPGLTIIPFLNKNDPADWAVLERLYETSDIFILPTRCECFGLVFCEAAAYALPSVASRTGGVPELILDGQTGYTIPLEEGAEAYADKIVRLWGDRDLYLSMSHRARRLFEERLNWNVWGAKLAALADRLLENKRAEPGAGQARQSALCPAGPRP